MGANGLRVGSVVLMDPKIIILLCTRFLVAMLPGIRKARRMRLFTMHLSLLPLLLMISLVSGLSISYCSSQNTGSDFQAGTVTCQLTSIICMTDLPQSSTCTNLTVLVRRPAKQHMPMLSSEDQIAGAQIMLLEWPPQPIRAISIAQDSHLRSVVTLVRACTDTMN